MKLPAQAITYLTFNPSSMRQQAMEKYWSVRAHGFISINIAPTLWLSRLPGHDAPPTLCLIKALGIDLGRVVIEITGFDFRPERGVATDRRGRWALRRCDRQRPGWGHSRHARPRNCSLHRSATTRCESRWLQEGIAQARNYMIAENVSRIAHIRQGLVALQKGLQAHLAFS